MAEEEARGLNGLLRRAIEAGVRSATKAHLASDAFAQRVMEVAMENPRFAFIKWMQARLLRADPSLSPKRSFVLARTVLNDFLKDEKIAFGDPRYDWSPSGAASLAEECEINYWDDAA